MASQINAGVVTMKFYAAAAEAAGAGEIAVELPGSPVRLQDLLDQVAHGELGRVCARSTFLLNAVHADPQVAQVHGGDQVDVLPPFAGG